MTPTTRAAATKKRTFLEKLALKVRYPYYISAVAFVLFLILFLFVVCVCGDVYKQLRGSMFTGLFAVAGFLLSAKTLVILNMKKEVYSTEAYLKEQHDTHWSLVAYEKKQEKPARKECAGVPHIYGPLSRIGTLLTANIIVAIVASFAQISIGLAETRLAIAFCMSLAFSAGLLLCCSVFLMWLNFKAVYRQWEAEAAVKLEEYWAAAAGALEKSGVSPVTGDLPVQPTVPPGEKLPGS